MQPEDIAEAALRAVRKRKLGRADEEPAKVVGALLQRGFDLDVARKAVAEEAERTKFDAPW